MHKFRPVYGRHTCARYLVRAQVLHEHKGKEHNIVSNIGKNNGNTKGFNLGSLFAGSSALQQAIAIPGAHMGMIDGAGARVGLECSWFAPDRWSCMFAGQFARAAVGVLGLEEHILTALEGRRHIAGFLAELCDIVDTVGGGEPWARERVLGKLVKLGAITRAPKNAGYMQTTPVALAFYRAWAHQAQHGGAAWTAENMRELNVTTEDVAPHKTPFIWKVPLSVGEMTPGKLEEIVGKTLKAESKLTMLGFGPGGFVIQAASTPDTRKLQPGARPRGLIALKAYRPEDGLVFAVQVVCNAGRVTLNTAIPRVIHGNTVLQEAHMLRGELEWKGLTTFPIVQEISEDYLRMFLNSPTIHTHFPELVRMLTPAPAQVVLNNMAGNPKLRDLMSSVEDEQRRHIADVIAEARLVQDGSSALVGATAAPVETSAAAEAPVGELEEVAVQPAVAREVTEQAMQATVGELEEVAVSELQAGVGAPSEDRLQDLIEAHAPDADTEQDGEHSAASDEDEDEHSAGVEQEEVAPAAAV